MVDLPLWKIWNSIGWLFPIYGKCSKPPTRIVCQELGFHVIRSNNESVIKHWDWSSKICESCSVAELDCHLHSCQFQEEMQLPKWFFEDPFRFSVGYPSCHVVHSHGNCAFVKRNQTLPISNALTIIVLILIPAGYHQFSLAGHTSSYIYKQVVTSPHI